MNKYMILIFCFQFSYNFAEEFVYPVADFDQGNQLILLYQRSLEEIELWFFDPVTHYAIKGLSSFSTPVNIRIMPCGKGFSFIDQGYIKIKEFAKRSARTLPIYEPIGLFSSMNWIDEENFYFVARQGDNFQIFTSNLQAQVCQLTDEKADALYPQIIHNQLFYIQRDTAHNFYIIQKNPDKGSQVILSLLDQPCFLSMISLTQGFYIQSPTHKSAMHDSCYELIVHQIEQQENKWTNQEIFKFYIPSRYLTGQDRLYESLEPFLPKYFSKEQKYYFSSWNQDFQVLQLYSYDTKNQSVKNIIDTRSNHFQSLFAPYIMHNKIHCGFIMQEQKNRTLYEHQILMPQIEIN